MEWDEPVGWVVSTMPMDTDPYPTQDLAINAARELQKGRT